MPQKEEFLRNLRIGKFIPFDNYEERILDVLHQRVNKYRDSLGLPPLRDADMVRGIVRDYCHVVLGQDISLSLNVTRER